MARKGRRELSPEERALWQQIASRTIPLRAAEAVEPPPPVPAPIPVPAPRPPAVRPSEPPRMVSAPDPKLYLTRATPHMDRRRFETLKRGRMEPEARIDLHGMTAERAHSTLHRFILSSHANGLRLVLVITGKGRPPDEGWHPGRNGILNHSLPHWLAMPPLGSRVLQVANAHNKHGGGGAFYVYLRRNRAD